jgi:chromosome segregation ATPase
MTEVENQLKEIEQTVESKEEMLLADIKSKDAILENIRGENDQLNGELQRLRTEIDRLQSAHNTVVNDNHALKLQLDERNLVNANSSSTTADDSYEFVKQPSPSSAEIDPRAEKLNELIGSTKEVIENQDSIVQQLDKYIDGMHRSGTGEISNIDDSTVSSSSSSSPASSDQQQSQS